MDFMELDCFQHQSVDFSDNIMMATQVIPQFSPPHKTTTAIDTTAKTPGPTGEAETASGTSRGGLHRKAERSNTGQVPPPASPDCTERIPLWFPRGRKEHKVHIQVPQNCGMLPSQRPLGIRGVEAGLSATSTQIFFYFSSTVYIQYNYTELVLLVPGATQGRQITYRASLRSWCTASHLKQCVSRDPSQGRPTCGPGT